MEFGEIRLATPEEILSAYLKDEITKQELRIVDKLRGTNIAKDLIG